MDGIQLNARIGAQRNSRKEGLRKGLAIAGGVLFAGVSIFAALQTKKVSNLRKSIDMQSNEIMNLTRQLKNLK